MPLRRIKCLYAPCEWYGRGVRESVLREQVIQTLSLLHQDLAALANRREVRINPEVEKIKAEIAQLVTLQHLPGIESLIDGQKKQLIALEKQPAGDDGMNLQLPVAVRKDVTFWRRFIPPLPRLLGGLFAGLLIVH